MTCSIIYEQNPLSKDTDILAKGIANNAKQHGLDPIEPFAFFIRNEDNAIKGGCNGNIGYNWLYIDQLWVDESYRGKGYGTRLMQAAEKLGLEKKCLYAAVNTASWEALDFYKKLGYRVELERDGLPRDSSFYFLRKDFIIKF